MFRILKLAVYAALGYFVYEFYRGLTDVRPSSGRPVRSGGDASRNDSAQPIHGQTVETLGSDGGAARHVVGRGVVRR